MASITVGGLKEEGIEDISDRVAVMYLGKIVEMAFKLELFRSPKHYCTQALLFAIPVPNKRYRKKGKILMGVVPGPINPPPDVDSIPGVLISHRFAESRNRNSTR